MSRRFAATLLMIAVAMLAAAGCANPGAEALEEAREREEEQHALELEEGTTASLTEVEERLAAEQVDRPVRHGDNDAPDGGFDSPAGDGEFGDAEDGEADGGEGGPPADEGEGDGDGSELSADDLDEARQTFSATCGSCHTLDDAGTAGTFGPDLDDSGLDAETVRTTIEQGGGGMPPNLLEGDEADLVAQYVAQVAGG